LTLDAGTVEAILRVRDDFSATLKTAGPMFQVLAQQSKALADALGGAEKQAKDAAGAHDALGKAVGVVQGKCDEFAGQLGIVGKALQALGPWGVAAAAGIGAVVAAGLLIGNMTLKFTEFAHALENQAIQSEVGTTTLQEYQVVAARLGMSSETITDALTRMTRAIASGSDDVKVGFANMGLSFDDLRKLSPQQEFEAVIKGLHDIPDPARQAQLAFQLFGRNMEILKVVRGNMDDLKKSAHDYGLVWGEDVIDKAAATQEAVEMLGLSWKHFEQSVVVGIATAPEAKAALDDLARSISSLAQPDNFKVIASFFKDLIVDLQVAAAIVKWVSERPKAAQYNTLFSGNKASAEQNYAIQHNAFGGVALGVSPQAEFVPRAPGTFDANAAMTANASAKIASDSVAMVDKTTKAYRQTVAELGKAQSEMMPVLDQVNGSYLKEAMAVDSATAAKVANFNQTEGLRDSEGKLTAQGSAMAGNLYAAANAQKAAAEKANDHKIALEHLKEGIAINNELAAATSALVSPYTAATEAVQREVEGKVAEYEATHLVTDAQVKAVEALLNMGAAARQDYEAKIASQRAYDAEYVATMRAVAAKKIEKEMMDQSIKSMEAQQSARDELSTAMDKSKSDYDQQVGALQREQAAFERTTEDQVKQGAITKAQADNLINLKNRTVDATKADLDYNHAVQQSVSSMQAFGSMAGSLSGIISDLGGAGSAAAKGFSALSSEMNQASTAYSTFKDKNASTAQKGAAGLGAFESIVAGGKEAGPGMGALSGAVSGAMAGSAFGAPGAIIGGGLGMLGGLFGGLSAQSEEKHVNDLRDAYTEQAGGINALAEAAKNAGTDLSEFYSSKTEADWTKAQTDLNQKLADGAAAFKQQKEDAIAAGGGMEIFTQRAAEAGYQLSGAFNTDNPENFLKSIDAINKGIADQDSAYGVADAAAKKYGLTTKELGSGWAKSNMDQQAAGLLQSWSALTARGADVVAVDKKMASDMNAYVKQCQQAGVTIPESMRGMLQSMADQGDLTDAAGHKLKDLSTLKFSADMTAQFKTLMSGIQDLVNSIKGIIPAAKDAGASIADMGSAFGSAQQQAISGAGTGGGGLISGAMATARSSGVGMSPEELAAHVEHLAGGGRVTQPGLAFVDANELIGTPERLMSTGAMGDQLLSAMATMLTSSSNRPSQNITVHMDLRGAAPGVEQLVRPAVIRALGEALGRDVAGGGSRMVKLMTQGGIL
jgi:hypothetical protein